jgi:hypothetical protein
LDLDAKRVSPTALPNDHGAALPIDGYQQAAFVVAAQAVDVAAALDREGVGSVARELKHRDPVPDGAEKELVPGITPASSWQGRENNVGAIVDRPTKSGQPIRELHKGR